MHARNILPGRGVGCFTSTPDRMQLQKMHLLILRRSAPLCVALFQDRSCLRQTAIVARLVEVAKCIVFALARHRPLSSQQFDPR